MNTNGTFAANNLIVGFRLLWRYWMLLLTFSAMSGCATRATPPDLYIPALVDRQTDTMPLYIFRTTDDVPSGASLHGNVMSMITEEEPYQLVTPGLVCTNGTPPYEIVVVGPSSEFEERSIIFMIRTYNQSLFDAGRINAANNCRLDD